MLASVHLAIISLFSLITSQGQAYFHSGLSTATLTEAVS